MHRRLLRYAAALCVAGVCLLSVNSLSTQRLQGQPKEPDCDELIEMLDDAIDICGALNNNWACYADDLVESQPAQSRFDDIGDRELIGLFSEITTNDKGIVLLRLLTGQERNPLDAILLGSIGFEPTRSSLISFRRVGGKDVCQQTGGMMVQTESREPALIRLNSVDINLGSTAYIALDEDDTMTVVNFEGNVRVSTDETGWKRVPQGYEIQIVESSTEPEIANNPVPSALVDSPVLDWIANEGLPRIWNPNETALACVGEIEFGTSVTERNYTGGQECLYTFCGQAGDVVTVEMDAIDGTIDPWLDLRGPDGVTIKYNDDIDTTERSSRLCNEVLPEDGCYTIVARSYRNETAGPFTLTMTEGESECEMPAMRCTVVTPRSLNLRPEPNIEADPIRVLARGTQLEPFGQLADGTWVEVHVVGSGDVGWVNADPRFLACEDKPWIPTVTITPTILPTETPERPDRPTREPTPRKRGVWTVP